MADGSAYEIDFPTKSAGMSAAADELNRLAASLDAAAKVSTSFDSVIARTETLLAAAATEATSTAEALAASSSKYSQLETAATRAAKAVEKAAAAGKPTAELEIAAIKAEGALDAEATALEAARGKASSAAAAHAQLAATLKTLEGAAKAEAAATSSAAAAAQRDALAKGKAAQAVRLAASAEKAARVEALALAKKAYAVAPALSKMGTAAAKSGDGMKTVLDASKGALGPMGGVFERANLIKTALGAGMGGAVVFATAAVLALSAAAILGVFSLAKLAVSLNKVAQAKLDKLAVKAKKDWAQLFSGVHVEKFTAGLELLENSLGKNTATGKALKGLISDLLNPLFDAIPKLVPIVANFFGGMVLGALYAEIAALKLYIAIKNLLPDSVKTALKDMTSNIDYMATAMWAGVIAVGVLALALTVLTLAAIALGVVIASPFILGAIVIAAVAAGVYFAITAFAGFIAWVKAVATALENFGAAAWAAAGSLIDGLVGGIKSGAGLVMQALKTLGADAIGALKKSLGIASPSKYALEFAGNVTRTFADTVEDGSGDAQAAMSSLAEPAVAPGGGKSGAGDGSQRPIVHVTINATDGTARGIAAEVRQVLIEVLEGDVLMLGGSLEEPA